MMSSHLAARCFISPALSRQSRSPAPPQQPTAMWNWGESVVSADYFPAHLCGEEPDGSPNKQGHVEQEGNYKKENVLAGEYSVEDADEHVDRAGHDPQHGHQTDVVGRGQHSKYSQVLGARVMSVAVKSDKNRLCSTIYDLHTGEIAP